MNRQRKARLGGRNPLMRWLVDPTTDIPEDAVPVLYGSLLAAPGTVIAAAMASLIVVGLAFLRTGDPRFGIFAAIEVALLLLRCRAIRRCANHFRAGTQPSIERSVALLLGWCALQGAMSFTIALTGDLPMIVIATAFIVGLVAPICARHYAAPRLAVVSVMLLDIPFKIGLALSGQPMLWILVPLGIPLFMSVRVLLRNFATLLAASLNSAEQNHRLASHDPLTGLRNRQGLAESLAQLIVAPDQRLALLCLDLDRFKPLNDQYGHAAGDAALVAVAERLRAIGGDTALIARLGGDEFLLAVSGLTPDQAQQLAERTAQAIAGRGYAIDGAGQVEVGVSIGYACFPEDATSVAQLRTRADDALYRAKRSGGVQRHRTRPPLDTAA
ncbi:GGDEF domain-containing protein [Nostoc sp. 3335mG]|nr:GGDEF domain-containing protein [Nostoc sp. 3335mG]